MEENKRQLVVAEQMEKELLTPIWKILTLSLVSHTTRKSIVISGEVKGSLCKLKTI